MMFKAKSAARPSRCWQWVF